MAEQKQPPEPEASFNIYTEPYFETWYNGQHQDEYCRSHGYMTPKQERNRAIVEKIQLVQWAVQQILTQKKQAELFGASAEIEEKFAYNMRQGKSLVYNVFTKQIWQECTVGAFVDTYGTIHGCCPTQVEFTRLQREHDRKIAEIREYLQQDARENNQLITDDLVLSSFVQEHINTYKAAVYATAGKVHSLNIQEPMALDTNLFRASQ